MDSQFYIGMPGIYLLHSARQDLFQTVALYISEVSSYWLCSADLGQGHLQGRREEALWWGLGVGLGESQRGKGWGKIIYSTQNSQTFKCTLPGIFQKWHIRKVFFSFIFPSVLPMPISMLSWITYFSWPSTGI